MDEQVSIYVSLKLRRQIWWDCFREFVHRAIVVVADRTGSARVVS